MLEKEWRWGGGGVVKDGGTGQPGRWVVVSEGR